MDVPRAWLNSGMNAEKLRRFLAVALVIIAVLGWLSVKVVDGSGKPEATSTTGIIEPSTAQRETTFTTGGDQTQQPYGLAPLEGSQCPYGTLPPQAQQQIEDILTGASPDDGYNDGKHFGNYEGLLPKRNSDYYREYTVKTPGLNHRGARRIVVGGGTAKDPDVWYYSGDHFQSFCSIPDAEG